MAPITENVSGIFSRLTGLICVTAVNLIQKILLTSGPWKTRRFFIRTKYLIYFLLIFQNTAYIWMFNLNCNVHPIFLTCYVRLVYFTVSYKANLWLTKIWTKPDGSIRSFSYQTSKPICGKRKSRFYLTFWLQGLAFYNLRWFTRINLSSGIYGPLGPVCSLLMRVESSDPVGPWIPPEGRKVIFRFNFSAFLRGTFGHSLSKRLVIEKELVNLFSFILKSAIGYFGKYIASTDWTSRTLFIISIFHPTKRVALRRFILQDILQAIWRKLKALSKCKPSRVERGRPR